MPLGGADGPHLDPDGPQEGARRPHRGPNSPHLGEDGWEGGETVVTCQTAVLTQVRETRTSGAMAAQRSLKRAAAFRKAWRPPAETRTRGGIDGSEGRSVYRKTPASGIELEATRFIDN